MRLLTFPAPQPEPAAAPASAASPALVPTFAYSKAQLLTWYVSVLQTPAGAMNEHHPLCQEYSVSPGGAVKVKMLSKMDAAKQLASLCGWNTEEQPEAAPAKSGLADLVAELRRR